MKKLDPVVQELIDKTYAELAQNKAKAQDSRNWKDPEGYRYLFPWSNAVLLRFLIRKFTDSLPKNEYRRKTQFDPVRCKLNELSNGVDDAGSSVVRNIEEGFKRPTTKEYLTFLGFSQASLEETKGNTRESADDGLLKSTSGSSLAGIGINLRDFRDSLLKDSKGRLKDVRGNQRDFSYRPLTVLYPPLNNLRAEDLTYEIFLELINPIERLLAPVLYVHASQERVYGAGKTDYLLRQLVISLEKKLNNDQKSYQIDQIRLNRRAKGD